ncbi:hypothetical protein [Spirosoma telluris]|uniref:hypothetical protein n=1 Tax=Spirosoma telluris TaxID=2183553 RepID=UPI0012FAF8A2
MGPTQWGQLNEGQQGRLMEIGAWHFINQEAVHNVRPWIVRNEGDIWLTKSKDGNTVYAYLTNMPDWPRGERRTFLLRSLNATGQPKSAYWGNRVMWLSISLQTMVKRGLSKRLMVLTFHWFAPSGFITITNGQIPLW